MGNEMTKQVNCKRCGIPFAANVLISNDDVCRTCNRLNDITFWYPVLFRSGIPVPKTIILHTNVNMEKLAWGEKPEGIDKFVSDVRGAAIEVGIPTFLRTGYSSNKHDWEESCFLSRETLKDKNKVLSHIINLAEHSSVMIIDRFTPCDFWAVREIIETEPYFTYFGGKMPITKERRFFIRNGEVECSHSYWPPDIFEDKEIGTLDEFTEEDENTMKSMAKYIVGKFSGYWSVDFLKGKNGTWYCTDMAIGESSYHQEHSTAKTITPTPTTHEGE